MNRTFGGETRVLCVPVQSTKLGFFDGQFSSAEEMTYTRRNKAAGKGIDFSGEVDEEEEEEEVCSLKPKRQKTNDGYYNVPIRSFDQIRGSVGNCDLVESRVSYFDGEIGLDTKIRSGRVVVNQNTEGDRPPLFKSARGRVQVLPRVFHLFTLRFAEKSL